MCVNAFRGIAARRIAPDCDEGDFDRIETCQKFENVSTYKVAFKKVVDSDLGRACAFQICNDSAAKARIFTNHQQHFIEHLFKSLDGIYGHKR